MTITQIIAMARKKLLEQTEEIFSSDDLLLYANLTKDEMAKLYLNENLVKVNTLNFVNGSVAVPTDWNGFYYATDNSAPNVGNDYVKVDVEEYQAGAYERMITELQGNLLLFPVETKTIYAYSYKKTADMALSPTIVNPPTELDDYLHEVIVYGIVYRALEDAQDFDLAKYYETKYKTMFRERTAYLSKLEKGNQQSGALLEPLPDLGFNSFGVGNPNGF